MPATPAWPQSSLPRLFVDELLHEGASATLSGPPAHYLLNVLRLSTGSRVKLFDDRSGEWLGEIAETGKKRAVVRALDRLRERETVPDFWLLFAPIKHGRIDWLVEKATELGVARLVPVSTRRTVVDRINSDRLRAHIIEAAEQCERTAIPELAPPIRLDTLLHEWPSDRTLLFADEQGGAPISDSVERGPTALLIGPEGGFTDDERASVRQVPRSRAVSLGPRILRADTAALAGISAWMALAGDWSRHAIR